MNSATLLEIRLQVLRRFDCYNRLYSSILHYCETSIAYVYLKNRRESGSSRSASVVASGGIAMIASAGISILITAF